MDLHIHLQLANVILEHLDETQPLLLLVLLHVEDVGELLLNTLNLEALILQLNQLLLEALPVIHVEHLTAILVRTQQIAHLSDAVIDLAVDGTNFGLHGILGCQNGFLEVGLTLRSVVNRGAVKFLALLWHGDFLDEDLAAFGRQKLAQLHLAATQLTIGEFDRPLPPQSLLEHVDDEQVVVNLEALNSILANLGHELKKTLEEATVVLVNFWEDLLEQQPRNYVTLVAYLDEVLVVVHLGDTILHL